MNGPLQAEQLREIISKARTKINLEELKDGDDLREAGADSLDMMTIILDVSELTGVEVPDEDVEDLATINGIVKYIGERS